MTTQNDTPCTMSTETFEEMTLNFHGVTASFVGWQITCSCSSTFRNRLLSATRSQWRKHAGVPDRRLINDATVLSK